MAVKNGTKSLNGFLFKTQNTILSAAMVLGLASGVSAILGLVKTRLLASYFGVSRDLAVFYTADRIPNLIYSVIIVGAVSTVFIPIFTGLLKKDEDTAFQVASSIINTTLLFFIVTAGIIFLISPRIINLLAVGNFSNEEILLGANLMRIMLVSQILLVAGSLSTSILQSFKYFIIPAFAPIFYNLGMIVGIVFLSNKYGIYGPAAGVALGSIFHFGIQLPLLKKSGFKFSLSLNFADKNFKKMLTLVPPRIASVLISNVIQTINNSLAIVVSASSVIFLKFADQLQTFPVSLFGISMAAASLPTLSSQSGQEDKEKFKETFLTSLHQMMYLVMPLSAILLILRVPAVRLVYGVSNFPWEATIRTAQTLAFFSISIFSQSANYLVTRAFYALKDTITPVTINVITAIINVILSIIFVVYMKLGVWSIALSYTITSVLDMFLLIIYLNKKVGGFNKEKLFIPLTKISWATASMGIMLYVPMKLLDQYVFDTTRTLNLLILTVTAGLIGMGTYVLLTSLLKVEEIELFYKLTRKLKLSKSEIKAEAVDLTTTEQETV
ncbi:murein biosynthesis integral membrane protein MurJ [Patescibacteria group bacterium]|nr:murein biosynthesis integral membrane protein MurJ [Patescibacteria group bacterium]